MRRYSIVTAILFNIIYILLGIIIMRSERGKTKFLGLVPIFLGGGTLLLGVIFNSRDFIMRISMFWFVIVLLDMIAIKIINGKKCNFKIEAVYVDKRYHSGYKGVHSYGPVFQYTYKGKEYRSEAKQYFSKDQMRLRFRIKKKYNIYICENDPELCIVDRDDDFVFSMICAAVIFVVLALAVYWTL